jgi:hypothetical protein
MEKVALSLLVPSFNEAPHFEKNLKRIKEVLDSSTLSYEIIIIDDTSTDKTVEIAEEFIKINNAANNLILIKHLRNQGRGKTVNDGIMAAKGDEVGFIDIDLSCSPWYILPIVAEIKKGADVVLGSRIYKLKFKTLHRWILSKGYKLLVRMLLRLDLGDTESGCKFFKREEITKVLPRIKDEKWFWDTEIIVRSRLAGLKIVDLPTVFVRESLYSRVKIIRDSWRHFINLWRFRREIGESLKNIR